METDRKQIDRDRMIDSYKIIDGDRDRYKYKAYWIVDIKIYREVNYLSIKKRARHTNIKNKVYKSFYWHEYTSRRSYMDIKREIYTDIKPLPSEIDKNKSYQYKATNRKSCIDKKKER